MRQSHRRVKTYAQRRLDSFCQCVCPCAHCRYTQHILTVYLSHVEISLEVSLGIKTFSKKTNKKKTKQKKHTVELFLNRTTPVHISPRHTRRRAFAMSLISGRFQEVVCDFYRAFAKGGKLVLC